MTVGISEDAQARYHFVRKLLHDYKPPPADVVELGAAPGDQIAALAAQYRATAVDHGVASDQWGGNPEGRMAELLKQTGVAYVEWDLEVAPYPLESRTFDAVILTEVFEHLREYPIHSLIEAQRILRPDGLLFFTTPNIAYVKNRIRALLGHSTATPLTDWIAGLPHARHAREYTFPEIHELMRQAKLRVVASESHHFFRTAGDQHVFPKLAKNLVEVISRVRPTLGPSIVIVATPMRDTTQH